MNSNSSRRSHESKATDISSKSNQSKRSRTARACDFCRRKKAKCLAVPGEPCSSCISYGVTCEFTDGSKKRGPPKGSRYVDTLEKRIRRIESVLTSAGPSKLKQPPRFIPYPKRKQEQGGSTDGLRFMGSLPELDIFRGRIHYKDYFEVDGQYYRYMGEHIVHMIPPTEDPISRIPQRAPPIPHTITGINHWIYSISGVDRCTSDRLLRIYFMNVHPLLPVVDKAEFLRQYRDQADTYPSADLLNAMFGAAARFVEAESRRQKHTNAYPDLQCEAPKDWHLQFFDQAHAILTINPPKASISIVQATVIIHNTSGNVTSAKSEGWLISGIAIRMAQYMALNRNCDDWDIPDNEKETRKRLWWCLYISDRFQAANMGRPICIYDEDNDVGYPEPYASWAEVLDEPVDEDDDEMPRFPSATFRPENITDRVEIYHLFVQLIKLSEILGHILQAIYTPRARKISEMRGWDQVMTRLDHELTEWRLSFPAGLQRIKHKDFDEQKGYYAPAIASIQLCYFACLILLHREFIERDSNNNQRASYSSFRISTSAATRGVRIAERLSVRDYLMLPYYFNMTPVLQCALIHIYNSKNRDPAISEPARENVRKAVSVAQLLKEISKRGEILYKLLCTIIAVVDIDVYPEKLTPDKEELKEEPICRSLFEKVSDVGRGVSPMQPQQQSPRSSSTDANVSMNLDQQHLQSWDSIINSELISGTTLSADQPLTNTEAYTIKQFGYDTPCGPGELEAILQNISNNIPLSEMLEPTASTLTYSLPTQGSFPSSSSALVDTVPNVQPHEPIQFRNNADNPFAAVPTSLDMSEWGEWVQQAQPQWNNPSAY
ncbi:fungal-specific transcription factor domain-containing protein [Fennellomyces sp. T-0311]|nr:fungal-specific transcription factor domain-containing protein [Fennellomyces sp. T-0311]